MTVPQPALRSTCQDQSLSPRSARPFFSPSALRQPSLQAALSGSVPSHDTVDPALGRWLRRWDGPAGLQQPPGMPQTNHPESRMRNARVSAEKSVDGARRVSTLHLDCIDLPGLCPEDGGEYEYGRANSNSIAAEFRPNSRDSAAATD